MSYGRLKQNFSPPLRPAANRMKQSPFPSLSSPESDFGGAPTAIDGKNDHITRFCLAKAFSIAKYADPRRSIKPAPSNRFVDAVVDRVRRAQRARLGPRP